MSNSKNITVLIGNPELFKEAQNTIKNYEKYRIEKFDSVKKLASWFYLFIDDQLDVNVNDSHVIVECSDKNMNHIIEELSTMQQLASEKRYSHVNFVVLFMEFKNRYSPEEMNALNERFEKTGLMKFHTRDKSTNDDSELLDLENEWLEGSIDVEMEHDFDRFANFCDTCSILFGSDDSSKSAFEAMPENIKDKVSIYLEKYLDYRVNKISDLLGDEDGE